MAKPEATVEELVGMMERGVRQANWPSTGGESPLR